MSEFLEILDAYPDCRAAILFCETILDSKEVYETILGSKEGCELAEVQTCFSSMRSAEPPVSLDEVLFIIRSFLEHEITKEDGIGRVCLDALHQLNCTSFRTYLRAKLGML